MKERRGQIGVVFALGGRRRFCRALASTLVCGIGVAGRAQPVQTTDDREPRAVASNQAVSLERKNLATPPTDEDRVAVEEKPSVDGDATDRRVSRRGGPAVVAPRDSEGVVPWYRSGIGALAIVLAGIGGVYVLLRRWLPAGRISGTDAIRIVGRTGLSPKHSLALVQLGRRFVLVGVSGERLESLCEVADPAEVAELAARTGSRLQAGAVPFEDALMKEAVAFTGPADGAGGRHEGAQENVTPRREEAGAVSSSSISELLRRLRVLQSR